MQKSNKKPWGLNPKIVWIYNAIIPPKISYGSAAWRLSLNKTQRNKLNALQNIILKTALCTATSIPKLAQAITTNNLPLELYIQQTCLYSASSLIAEKHWTRKTHNHRKTNFKTLMETIDGELRCILDSTYNDISDKIRPALNINQNYSTNIPRRSEFKVSNTQHPLKYSQMGPKMTSKIPAMYFIS